MYNYEWDKKTRGYRLVVQTGKFVATEIRPVFAEELKLIGFDEHFSFDENEKRPLMWAKNNVYIYNGEEVAKLHKTQLGKPLEKEYLTEPCNILSVNIEGMIVANKKILDSMVSNTLKRIKEIHDSFRDSMDVVYIAFSGGKDSVLLLDLCDQVLPATVPVIFSDTTMELPTTYQMWEDIQKRYPERLFLKYSSEKTALENWEVFGPPSRTVDWCCAVHKSAPVIMGLKRQFHLTSIKTLAYLGIRSEESLTRNSYEGDIGIGVKNASQVNAMPIESWGAHELYIYLFWKQLPLNDAYRKGLPRIGCIMCPKASEKYAWFVDKSFPNCLDLYKNIIVDSSLKNFSTTEDAEDYIASSGWQARKNGLEIKKRIYVPSEKSKGNETHWFNVKAPLSKFLEWCKTIAKIEFLDEHRLLLSCLRQDQAMCSYDIDLDITEGVIQNIHAIFNTKNATQKTNLLNQLKKIICKSIACIGCKVCEAECSHSALKINENDIKVDTSRCIHCLKCHNINYGCWRYKSMMVPNSTNTPLKSIANYQNFGLRDSWVEVYASEREEFANTTAFGLPMVDSARIWFKQSLLTKDSRTLEPGKLLDVVNAFGVGSDLFWNLVWIALANNAPLIKWVVTSLVFNEHNTIDDIYNKLGDIVSDYTKKGGVRSLLNMFKSSPLGMGENPMVELTLKGTRVLGLKRLRKSVEPLVVLYSLYLMANIAGRTSFTLSEMMTADFESPYISPLIAFGMDIAELKGQCMGLASRYPKYISCSFTLGLDEVTVFPQEKSLDDVVDLILGE